MAESVVARPVPEEKEKDTLSVVTFQPAKYAASTQYNSTQTLNSVAETHLTKETGTSSRSRFPKIVLRDTKGKELDTDSVYQQALYEAKWRQTHGEQPINPEEWRLPHGKLPARPDFSRHAPYLRPNQPGRKKKKHSRHRTCPASLPGSLRDFFEANDPQYLQTSQSMQTLDTLNTYQSLPSIPQAVRKEKKTKDKSFMQIVQTVRFHAKDVSETEKRDKEYVPPELCTFCQRMLSDNMLCPSCMGNRHHVHETWQTHLKPVRTGGGWTFFKRGFGVGPEELYEFDHKEDDGSERNETKPKPFHLHTEELRRKKLEQGEADVHYEHAHEGKPGSSVYYEDTDYPDLDQYGVTIKVSKIQDGPVKEVAQPGEELGPWIAVEGTGRNATGVTEENSKERGKLYQAPAAFRLKKREGGDTVAVDPFSKNRHFNLPKGTGLDIKKSDKELTKFVEIKRDVKYKEPEPFGLKETDHNQEPWEPPLRPVEEEKVPAIAASTPASSATVDSVTVPGTPVDSDVNPIAHVDSAKEEPLTSTPRVVEVPATPDKRQGTPDSGVESSPEPPKEPTPPPPKEPTPEPPKEPTPPPPPPPVQKKVIKGLTKVAKPEPPKKEVKVYKAPPPPLPPPKKKPPTPPPKEPTPPPPKEPTPVPTPTPTPPPKEPTPLPTPSPSPSPEIVFEKDSDDEDYVRVEEEEVEIEGPTPPPKSPTPTPPPPKPKRKMLPKRKPRVTLRAIAKATAPMPKSDLQEMTDPLDLLAKYCIIHPDRMPFYERIFAETIEEQSERYKNIPPSKYSMKFKEKYKNPFDLDLEEEEEQGKPKSLPKGTGGIVTQMSATLGGGATAGDDNNAALPPVAEGVAPKDMDDDKDSGISLPSVDKVKFRDMGLLNRAGQYEFLVGQSAADVLSKKLDYSMDRMTQKYRKLIVKKLTLQSQKKQFIFNTIKEDLPDLMRPDYDTFAKGKGKGKKKNQVLVTEMPSTQDEQQPKKKLTADEIIGRLDSKMWSMISNMPEVTRTDAQLSIIEKKMAELEARMNITDEEKREMEIYTRDLFLKEQIENERTREFRRKQSPLYQQINPVPDVEINVEEVEAALQRINNNLLTDREFQFVYHVLDLPGRHRLNLKLFSAVAALSEKVKQLDPITRKLINKFDFEALDIKMGKCKELFFLLDNQTAGMPDGRIDADTLAIELAAGGITPEHTQWVVNKFNRYKNGMVEFLDFLIYCPLFIEVHERIIKDPLNVAVWRLDDDRKEMEVKS
ncbi:uncharacterized protein LOC106167849 isoform X3 [Lingula anatina]|uniref:Uncharacterized protein LOC106167849 isoform X3 n=1 Tax=Lingula anatina TaxID=7574 RepID=A0A2R2MTN5_LINAN|nr:uncharacterized protein LOC106167849 isoform X3 [Lingula anatina]|eukprot:XP_023933387.1 uncharacterized protein LOC106167849 isoform X3 [Lingula anatina]